MVLVSALSPLHRKAYLPAHPFARIVIPYELLRLWPRNTIILLLDISRDCSYFQVIGFEESEQREPESRQCQELLTLRPP